jgi:hypothetical protein
VNERVKDINDQFHVFTALGDWICECANESCAERIEMTVREYEHVRSTGQRFFVTAADEHVWPDVELVVERHAKYWVVEKIERAGDVAKAMDPRATGPVSFRG